MRFSVGLVGLVLMACGPSTGGTESGSSGVGETTSEGETSGTVSSGVPTSEASEPTTDPTGTVPQTTCEDFLVFAQQEVAAGILLLYRFGNEEAVSDFQVFVDGSIFHREATCCPLTEEYPAETILEPAALTALETQAAAVLAGASETTNLGPMTAGQQTGVMCVVVNGMVGTVKLYEPGAEVTRRASTAPEAADIAALVHSYTLVDMPAD